MYVVVDDPWPKLEHVHGAHSEAVDVDEPNVRHQAYGHVADDSAAAAETTAGAGVAWQG